MNRAPEDSTYEDAQVFKNSFEYKNWIKNGEIEIRKGENNAKKFPFVAYDEDAFDESKSEQPYLFSDARVENPQVRQPQRPRSIRTRAYTCTHERAQTDTEV